MKKYLLFFGIMVLNICLAYSQVADPDTNKTNGPGYSPSLFYYVVIYRTALELPDYMIDTLNSRALTAKALETDNPDFNLREYERRIVKLFLSDDQYSHLLVLKNKPIAKELASKVWAGMLKQQLVSDVDDPTLYGRIYSHFLTALVTRDYFIDNRDEQSKYLSELDKQAPSPLYKYFHHGYNKPVVINPNRAELVW